MAYMVINIYGVRYWGKKEAQELGAKYWSKKNETT